MYQVIVEYENENKTDDEEDENREELEEEEKEEREEDDEEEEEEEEEKIELLQDKFKTINSDPQKHYNYLVQLLQFNSTLELSTRLKLLFRASEHNFSADKFHKCCDFKGPTITIIRSTDQRIFGGYSSESWFSNGYCSEAPGSFLFSLDKETKHVIYNWEKSAIKGKSKWGPIFGHSTINTISDLEISDHCNINNKSINCLGHTYSLPNDHFSLYSYEARSYLSGSADHFRVEEYEVYKLILDRGMIAKKL